MNDNEKVITVLEGTKRYQEVALENARSEIERLAQQQEAQELRVLSAEGLIRAIDQALDDLRAKVAAESGGVYFTPPDEHIPDESPSLTRVPEEADYDPFETTSSEEPKDKGQTF